MKGLIMEENLTHAYVQSHGFKKDYYKFGQKNIWGNFITIYHSVFGPMVRQGSSIRCVIGNHLNKRYGGENTFDIEFVRKEINNILKIRSDITFVS